MTPTHVLIKNYLGCGDYAVGCFHGIWPLPSGDDVRFCMNDGDIFSMHDIANHDDWHVFYFSTEDIIAAFKDKLKLYGEKQTA